MENFRNEEFQEEEIWGVFNQTKDSSWTAASCNSSSSSSSFKAAATAKRMTIPKSDKKVVQELSGIMSAPVNIPADWSKLSFKKPCSSSWLDDDGEYSDDDDGEERGGSVNAIIPPHEVVARRQMTSFSVFEGVGRTLKGRDLSRVRNAVLTKTGFLESN